MLLLFLAFSVKKKAFIVFQKCLISNEVTKIDEFWILLKNVNNDFVVVCNWTNF